MAPFSPHGAEFETDWLVITCDLDPHVSGRVRRLASPTGAECLNGLALVLPNPHPVALKPARDTRQRGDAPIEVGQVDVLQSLDSHDASSGLTGDTSRHLTTGVLHSHDRLRSRRLLG